MVGIAPGNQMGTHRGPPPYLVGNSPYVTIYGHGIPHTMYFFSKKETITKINQVPYQVINYDDKGMFQAKLMDNTQVKIFIDNGATPSILPLNVYNKYPILQKYPKTESHTAIHTGGGMIESHFWIEIPLRLENHIIQIKTLVCDLECPYDIVLDRTSLAQLSA